MCPSRFQVSRCTHVPQMSQVPKCQSTQVSQVPNFPFSISQEITCPLGILSVQVY